MEASSIICFCDTHLSYLCMISSSGSICARLYRYFKPKGGKVKCTPESLKLWKTKEGRLLLSFSLFFVHCFPFQSLLGAALLGQELSKMFAAHGSFETLEIQVKKRHLKSVEKSKLGGWYTKQYLESKEGWTKSGSYIGRSYASISYKV